VGTSVTCPPPPCSSVQCCHPKHIGLTVHVLHSHHLSRVVFESFHVGHTGCCSCLGEPLQGTAATNLWLVQVTSPPSFDNSSRCSLPHEATCRPVAGGGFRCVGCCETVTHCDSLPPCERSVVVGNASVGAARVSVDDGSASIHVCLHVCLLRDTHMQICDPCCCQRWRCDICFKSAAPFHTLTSALRTLSPSSSLPWPSSDLSCRDGLTLDAEVDRDGDAADVNLSPVRVCVRQCVLSRDL